MANHSIIIIYLLFCFSVICKAQNTSLQEQVNRKQYAVVIAAAKELSAQDSTDFGTMNAIAQAYEGVLKYREALSTYEHCLQMDTTNADILNALARTAINLGKATDAEAYFQRVIQSDSTNFYSNYQLARLYFQLGKYQQAMDKYQYLLEQDEENPTLLRSIGDCYTRIDSLYAASCSYSLAYDLNLENAGLANQLINTYLRMGPGFIPDALEVCDTALYYSPNNRPILQSKGMALYMNKDYTHADSLFSDLLAQGDSSFMTLKYLGSSRYYLGQNLKAIEPLEFAHEIDTTNVEVCLLLGSVLGKTYDRQRAYSLFNKAEQEMLPAPFLITQLQLFRAETMQRDGREPEAIKIYYKVWQEDPKRIDLLHKINNLTGNQTDVSKYKDEEGKQRSLFTNVLLAKEYINNKLDLKNLFFHKRTLQSFYDDMFFQNITEHPMLAPDGKKSKIDVLELRSIINKIPDRDISKPGS